MKFAIVLFAVVAVASAALLPAAPAPSADATAETLRNEAVVGVDAFNYAYETSNGIKAEEQGQLKAVGENQAIASQGSYSWTAPDGQQFTVTYVADENGFQPQGAHLPVAPVA